MNKLYRAAKGLFAAGVIAFVAVCILIWFVQEDILFQGTAVPENTVYQNLPNIEDLWLHHPDGARLHIAKVTAANEVGTMLYFHGNAAYNAYLDGMVNIYGGMGYTVVGLDYRGFGKSRGERSEAAMLEDALAFYDKIVPAGSPPPLIVGRSLGATFATYVASKRPASRLVLYSPPGSILDAAKRHYPWIPSFLLRYPLRTDEYMKNVAGPVLIFHGTDDKVVPFESGAILKQYLKPSDRFVPIPGGTHRDIPWRNDVQRILQKELAVP